MKFKRQVRSLPFSFFARTGKKKNSDEQNGQSAYFQIILLQKNPENSEKNFKKHLTFTAFCGIIYVELRKEILTTAKTLKGGFVNGSKTAGTEVHRFKWFICRN